ncbi:MAG: carboxypeptidase regulatory-like domain-containing protein [Thermoplasmatales archaeon]|nr:carboxypeptidase regulatory-like domain-containing protein [Thermoplasmatales archaeon]
MKKVFVACFFAILMLMIPFATAAQTADISNIKNVSSTDYTTPKILLTIAQNYQIDGYIEAYIPEEHKSTAYDIKNQIIKPYDADYYEVDVLLLAEAWATHTYQPIPQQELDDIPYGDMEALEALIYLHWALNIFGGLIHFITGIIQNRLGWLHFVINKGYDLCVDGVFLAIDFALAGYQLLLDLVDAINIFLTIPQVFSNAMEYLFNQQFNKFINEILEFTGAFIIAIGILLIDLTLSFQHIEEFKQFLRDIGAYIDYFIPDGPGERFPWREKIQISGVVKNFFVIPVSGATVTCKDQTTTTDESGSFSFEFDPTKTWGDSFPPNEYIGFHNFQITVEKNGELLKETPVALSYVCSYGSINWPFFIFKSRPKTADLRPVLSEKFYNFMVWMQNLFPNFFRQINRINALAI